MFSSRDVKSSFVMYGILFSVNMSWSHSSSNTSSLSFLHKKDPTRSIFSRFLAIQNMHKSTRDFDMLEGTWTKTLLQVLQSLLVSSCSVSSLQLYLQPNVRCISSPESPVPLNRWGLGARKKVHIAKRNTETNWDKYSRYVICQGRSLKSLFPFSILSISSTMFMTTLHLMHRVPSHQINLAERKNKAPRAIRSCTENNRVILKSDTCYFLRAPLRKFLRHPIVQRE